VEQSLATIFTAQTIKNWEDAANRELEEGKQIAHLLLQHRGIAIKPYYTAEDSSKNLTAPLPASTNPYGSARQWANMPKVLVEDEKKANRDALDHLQHGADGILFEIINPLASPEKILEGVELNYCSICFIGSHASIDFLTAFHAYAEKKFDASQLTGAIFWQTEPDINSLKKYREWANFHPCGITIQSQQEVATELATAIASAFMYIKKFIHLGYSENEATKQIAFYTSVGNDFFACTKRKLENDNP
jgi:methylmalonyl-CoA mutase